MEENLRAQIETYISHLNGLIRRGLQLRDNLSVDPADGSVIAATRAWQEECGVTINELSGGSKAHWLARAFSQSFLMRAEDGGAAVSASPVEIVKRLIDVLEQAVASLSGTDLDSIAAASSHEQAPRRFEFVHNPELRPVLEPAFRDGKRAIEDGNYELALQTTSGILEAIVTDALEHKGLVALSESGAPAGKISDWSFDTRLAVAERVGLIRGGCARLPAVARAYRDADDSQGGESVRVAVSERDAKQTVQVLRVIMRDLDPRR